MTPHLSQLDKESAPYGSGGSRLVSGFTLIELLVVVAIIAILAGLLLPGLAAGRNKARGVPCLNQVRQLGIAFRIYADENEGLLPADPPFVFPNAWIPLVLPYLAQASNALICPRDAFGDARRAAGRASYVLNQYTASGSGDPQPYPIFGPNGEPIPAHEFSQSVESYPRPSETYLTFEVSNVGNGGGLWHDDHTHPVTWSFGWQHVLADMDPERHGHSAHYLFADHHAASIPSVALQRRIEAGDNFSLIAR